MDKAIQQLRETAIAAEAQQRLKYQQLAAHNIALFSFPPNHCPFCGREFEWDQVGMNDFEARNSFTCPGCKTKFQQVDGPDLLRAAQDAGGDLLEMIERDIL